MVIAKRTKYPIVDSIKVHENDMATAVVHLPCTNKTRNDYHEKAMLTCCGFGRIGGARLQVIEAFKVEIE